MALQEVGGVTHSGQGVGREIAPGSVPCRVIERIIDRARRKLAERGIDPSEPFPARLVRDLLPTCGRKRMCLEAVYRSIARGQLDAVRIGREWYSDLEGFRRWIARRTLGDAVPLDSEDSHEDQERARSAVARRLVRRGRRNQ